MSTRDRLISAAIDLVSAGDENALTLRALGDSCGLSRGAPYRHFDDKDALVRAVAARGFRDLTAKMQRAGSLRAALRAYVKWGTDNPALYNLTFRSSALSDAKQKQQDAELLDAASGLLAVVTGTIESAQAAGELPVGRPEEVVRVLWAALHGAVDLANTGHRDLQPRAVVDGLMHLIGA